MSMKLTNATVSGKSSSSGEVILNIFRIGWNVGFSYTPTGSVNTARKGNTAPKLNISANPGRIIKIIKIEN